MTQPGVVTIHAVLGFALVAVAAAVAVLGLVRRRSLRLGGARREDRWFTQGVALAQTLVAGCGVFGLVAWMGDRAPSDPLHARVYGPFMVVAMIGAYSFRTDDRRWNATVFAVACAFVAGLGVRALFTG